MTETESGAQRTGAAGSTRKKPHLKACQWGTFESVYIDYIVYYEIRTAMNLYNLEYEKKIFNEIRSLHLNRYLMINRLLSIYTLRIL